MLKVIKLLTGKTMLNKIFETSCSIKHLLTAGAFIGLTLTAVPASSTEHMDPEADKILKSMSTYLGSLSAFSMEADIDMEILNFEGQKLQLSSSVVFNIERPGKLHIERQGAIADTELFFDGKTLSIYGNNYNAYYQIEQRGTIDDAINAFNTEIGLDAPGGDLLHADSYSGLASGVTSSAYHGTAFVGGVECHYLTFREDIVDWQLWVKVGDEPLPMKYVITTKWMTGAPQHSLRYRNWNTKAKIKPDQFIFSAPKGAKKLTSLSVDEMGEPVMGEMK